MAKKIDRKTEELQKQLVDLKEKYKRALADYQNLQNRVEKEREEFLKFATSSLITKFLDILDNLQKAQEHLKDKGLDLLIKDFKEILRQEGVAEIMAVGQRFDPAVHECVGLVKVKDKNLEDKVVEEVRRGYQIQVGDESRVLRFAQVKVGKKEIPPETGKAEKIAHFGKYV